MNLGAIVLLRTLLNYFLEQEIRAGEKHHAWYGPFHRGSQDLSSA